jgi:hypothetical protein
MSVDKSGKWWVGSNPNDIREFLESYTSDGYVAQEFRLAKCVCGSDTFELFADDGEGVAQRVCTSCGVEHFICDSEEYWAEATPKKWKCIECGSTRRVAQAFPLFLPLIKKIGCPILSRKLAVGFQLPRKGGR